MYVAIIGGKLQGTEAAYLAKKAGWRTLLIDTKKNTPASGLCDITAQMDICHTEEACDLLSEVDLIIPTLEDRESLSGLQKLADKIDLPVAFDFHSFALTASKSKSNELMENLGLSIPGSYPPCHFPIVVKPGDQSGSRGLSIVTDEQDLCRKFNGDGIPDGWVAQKFIEGPSFSLEVIGVNGRYITPQVTELHMNKTYDCKGVTAPADISDELRNRFEELSIQLADAVKLNGIMDVEVILHKEKLHVLEIDARLPSQTPIAVYWSTGINMLEMVKNTISGSTTGDFLPAGSEKCVHLEHVRVAADSITFAGEHLMTGCSPLTIVEDFFGATEAITDYRPGSKNWAATLIHVGENLQDLITQRKNTIENIRRQFDIQQLLVSNPEFIGDVHEVAA